MYFLKLAAMKARGGKGEVESPFFFILGKEESKKKFLWGSHLRGSYLIYFSWEGGGTLPYPPLD